MKAWSSIESLAEDQRISERTAWRWVRSGRIRKERGEDGRILFTLAIPDTDTADVMTVSSDIAGMSVNDRGEGFRSDLPSVVQRPDVRRLGKNEPGIIPRNKTLITLAFIESFFKLLTYFRLVGRFHVRVGQMRPICSGYTERQKRIDAEWKRQWTWVETVYDYIQHLTIASDKGQLRSIFNGLLEVRNWVEGSFGRESGPEDDMEDPQTEREREKQRKELQDIFDPIFLNLKILISEG